MKSHVLATTSMIFLAMLWCACQTTFQQKTIVKRDRFGESPVQDMRTGKSFMEWRYDETLSKERQVRREEEAEAAEDARTAEADHRANPQPAPSDSKEAEEDEGWFARLFE